jgi:hypothetical protein
MGEEVGFEAVARSGRRPGEDEVLEGTRRDEAQCNEQPVATTEAESSGVARWDVGVLHPVDDIGRTSHARSLRATKNRDFHSGSC